MNVRGMVNATGPAVPRLPASSKALNAKLILVPLFNPETSAVHMLCSGSVRSISVSDQEVFTKGMQNPQIVADAVSEQGMKCIEEGADVVIVGCNGLGPLCTMSGVVELGEDHVPLLDCVSVAIKTAEAVVDLRKRLGLPAISRAGLYRIPREKDIKRVRAIFLYF